MGRPSDFTQEVADLICARLRQGWTLREVCRSDDMPAESTVRTWAYNDQNGFYAQYARAREIGYQAMADEVLEISDDGTNDWMERQGDDGKSAFSLNGEHVQRSRLRVDTRKWVASKLKPKKYGDRQILAGDAENPVKVQTSLPDEDRALLDHFIKTRKP